MDMLNEWLDNQPKRARALAEEELIIDVSEEIWATLNKAGISQAELANKLDVSRPRISKLLDGSANMTLRTLADIAFELGKRVSISLQDRHAVDWKQTTPVSGVLRFEVSPQGPRQGKVVIDQWKIVNDNRFEYAVEPIAA